MVQSIVHIAEYICVPNLKSILHGSEYSTYSRYMCSKLKDPGRPQKAWEYIS